MIVNGRTIHFTVFVITPYIIAIIKFFTHTMRYELSISIIAIAGVGMTVRKFYVVNFCYFHIKLIYLLLDEHLRPRLRTRPN